MSSSTDESQGIEPALDPDIDATDAGRSANIKQIRGSSLLLVGRMIGLGLDFVAQVLIVRYLDKTEYGAFALRLSIVALGTTVCLLGLERTVGRFAPIYQERGDLPRMWGTIVVVVSTVATIGLALILAAWAFQGLIGGVVQNELALSILLIMIVLAPLTALDSLLIALFATFGSARSIFFRRYVFAPVLQLSVVIVLIASNSDVRLLALGYVLAAAAGIAIYSVVLLRLLQRQGLLAHLRRDTLRLPAREIFTFSIPLMASDLVFVLRSSLTIIFLEVLRSTEEVADFRAVLPIAIQNMFVATSFRFIFTPGASRLWARDDRTSLNDLYWQTAVWIAILSFPVFALSLAFATPIAVLLFGEPYRSSGTILSILCIGYYVNAAVGFNSLLLRVFGRVRYMVTADLATAAISIVATILLIRRIRRCRCGHRDDRLVPAPERAVPVGPADAHHGRCDRYPVHPGLRIDRRRGGRGRARRPHRRPAAHRRRRRGGPHLAGHPRAQPALTARSSRRIRSSPASRLVRRIFGDPGTP